jgi:hypothetical protein
VDQRRISEQADVHHPPRLYHRPVDDRACRISRVLTATPTFFINAERIKGAISFVEFDKRIKQLLMK